VSLEKAACWTDNVNDGSCVGKRRGCGEYREYGHQNDLSLGAYCIPDLTTVRVSDHKKRRIIFMAR